MKRLINEPSSCYARLVATPVQLLRTYYIWYTQNLRQRYEGIRCRHVAEFELYATGVDETDTPIKFPRNKITHLYISN